MSVQFPAPVISVVAVYLLFLNAYFGEGHTATTTPAAATATLSFHDGTCDMARVKCAYRVGCGAALHEYMVHCSDIMAGRTKKCKLNCQRALIALTSTEEGKALMACNCNGSQFCEVSKQRVEVCRPEVSMAVAEGSVVSCSVAQWICSADHLCSTALSYYHQFCRPMFNGRRCSPRCNNSIGILDRQEKASKLRTCYCDGTEEFDCKTIRRNTNRLCFGRETGGQIGGPDPSRVQDDTETDSDEDSEDGSSGNGAGFRPEVTEPEDNGIFGDNDFEEEDRPPDKTRHRKPNTSASSESRFKSSNYHIVVVISAFLTLLRYDWLSRTMFRANIT